MVGGGLASIDVVKVLMLETTRAKLRERGIEVGDGRARGEGHPEDPRAATASRFEDLGLAGCTLFYRRRAEDMPLVEIPDGATPERAAKVLASRGKLLEKAMEKYRFRVEPLCMPDGLIVEKRIASPACASAARSPRRARSFPPTRPSKRAAPT